MVGTFTVPIRLIFANRETSYTIRKVDRHTRGVEIWFESQSKNNQQTLISTVSKIPTDMKGVNNVISCYTT
jgi:hypothetical protein